ncbi:hypothetical protein VZT92_004799 [Zoarces viviparus]|uniref:Uncharacterized protein n=1 Tax=Zoarces viviparus TaxID=48416 RepID=A0AAW1FSV5_ZOAVI
MFIDNRVGRYPLTRDQTRNVVHGAVMGTRPRSVLPEGSTGERVRERVRERERRDGGSAGTQLEEHRTGASSSSEPVRGAPCLRRVPVVLPAEGALLARFTGACSQ